MKVTIKDVARRAGVSTATVSYVLNKTNRVGSQTRQRVVEAAEEMGYQPNAMAQGLVMRKTKTIGLVIPHSAEFIVSDPYFPEMLRGVGSVASAEGYYLLLSMPQGAEDFDQACSSLYTQNRVDGMILVSTPIELKDMADMRTGRVPMVLLGDTSMSSTAAVDIDNEMGSYKAAEHLISLGHRSIACITGDMKYDYAVLRYRGFERALQDGGLHPAAVYMGDFTRESGRVGAQQLLQGRRDMTAMVCGNDLMALGALDVLRQQGRRVPEDISVVGFDDVPAASTAEPPLTTVRQPVVELGRTAAQLLLKVMENEGRSLPKRVLRTELVVRSSTAAISSL